MVNTQALIKRKEQVQSRPAGNLYEIIQTADHERSHIFERHYLRELFFDPNARDVLPTGSQIPGKKYVFLTNKGTSAFFIILKVISRDPTKKK